MKHLQCNPSCDIKVALGIWFLSKDNPFEMYRLFPHLCSATPREETLDTESHQSSGGQLQYDMWGLKG